ncbi:MAG: hypothetical protein ABI980_14760 [Nitrospirota bacterium]
MHRSADVADIPSGQIGQGLGFLFMAIAQLSPIGGDRRAFILSGPGAAENNIVGLEGVRVEQGAARPSFLLAEAPR